MNLPQGWWDETSQRLYAEMIEKIPDGGVMIELGCWKGRSICAAADLIKKKGLKVHVVDIFTGTENEGEAHSEAKIIDIEAEFRQNIRDFGIEDQVYVHRGRTDEEHIHVQGGSVDLIMIDADHSAEAVEKDIRLWSPKLKSTGILCGDDVFWPSVREGWTRAGIEPVTEGNFWFVLPLYKSSKPLFSAVLIARNESKHLPKAIASLKEFQARGGEIVVVDTGSKDNTAQIARDAGCVVEEVGERFLITLTEETAKQVNDRFIVGDETPVLKAGDRIFDFGSARNYCVSLASNDFVSFMDCDEMFEKLDIDKINEVIQRGYTQLEYLFQFSPTNSFIQSKAYDRRVMRWDGIIHEVLQGNGRRKFFDRSVFYLRHEQNQETDRSGYLRGLAVDCFNHPDADRQSHYFARELMWTGRPKSAIHEFKRHVAMKRWPTEASQSYCFLGDCYMQIGEEEKAVEAWHKAYDIESGRREPLIRLASYYKWKKDWSRAISYTTAALTIPKGDFYANDSNLYEHVPHEILYESLWWSGNKSEALEHWKVCLGYLPDNPKYLSDAQYFPELLPKVSILVPTLGRPEGLKRLQDSIDAQVYPKDKIEVLIDEREEPTVPHKVLSLANKATGEWFMYAANDLELDPFCIMNAMLYDFLEGNKGGGLISYAGKQLIAINDAELVPDGGNRCAHFFIRKALVPCLEDGQIFSTDFNHVGCDNWLVAQAEKLGLFARSERAKAIHHHFSHGSEYDWIYKRGWALADQDRATLAKKLATL